MKTEAAKINAEQGAHADLGMDERAFSILRIMESVASEIAHAALQAAAIAIGAVYATAQQSQPSWFFMETYTKGNCGGRCAGSSVSTGCRKPKRCAMRSKISLFTPMRGRTDAKRSNRPDRDCL